VENCFFSLSTNPSLSPITNQFSTAFGIYWSLVNPVLSPG